MTADADGGRWPTFLVIGAARAGTTALHGMLRQHPQVCVPRNKEPSYFAMRAAGIDLDVLDPVARLKWGGAVSDEAGYRALFAGSTGGEDVRAWGECSPVYMPVKGVAEAIRSVIPGVRLIAVLRDPVDRAISHHAHNIGIGAEGEADFVAACERDAKKGEHAEYIRQGLYAALLGPFLSAFGREALLLLDHAELSSAPGLALPKVFAHIGVSADFRLADSERVMVTAPAVVEDGDRARLAEFFRADTARLIEHYGFDAARVWSSAGRR